jgi:hypothetical protein
MFLPEVLSLSQWVSRAASLLIAIIYLTVTALISDRGMVFTLAVYLTFPWALIWYGDEIARLRLSHRIPWDPSPGPWVRFMGWILLLQPLLLYIIIS